MDKIDIRADFHIHTPSSSDYKGPTNDDEYYGILKQAIKNELSIIAITDHNSIEGYRYLISLKKALILKRDELENITDSQQAQDRIKDIDSKLSLFSQLLILPGVEFEASPGIHILVIFNPDTPIKDIDNFLELGGYGKSQHGLENPTVISNWDVLDLFKETSNHDCLVIDAHTDSNKGIYKTQTGQYRAKCFKSSQLNAIGYNNEKQKDQIKSLLNVDSQYKRNEPIAFIKASDSHQIKDVGSSCTWIKIEEVDFEHLKSSFSNPTECIFTERPALLKILKDLIERNDSYGIKSIETDDIVLLKKHVCALNNENGGYCLLGVTDMGNKVGLPIDISNQKAIDEQFKPSMKIIFKALSELTPIVKRKINFYPLQNSRLIISIYVKSSSDLCCIKNENLIYYIKNKKIISLNSNEIQMLVEDRITDVLDSKIEKNLLSIQKESDLIINTFKSMPILRHFEELSVNMRTIITDPDFHKSIKVNKDEQTKLNELYNKSHNGKSRGSIFIINDEFEARFSYAYLRYSLPVFYYRNISTKLEKPQNKEVLYLVPDGGLFYSKRIIPMYSNSGLFALVFSSNNKSTHSTKFICGFLKSSFSLWYSIIKFESTNFSKPSIFKNLRLPKIDIKNPNVKIEIINIEQAIDDILIAENDFLTTLSKSKKPLKLVETHNNLISELANKIDQSVYKLLSLSDDQIDIIEKYLIANDIWLHPKDNK